MSTIQHTIECPHCDDGDGVCRTASDGTECDTCGDGAEAECRVCDGLGEVHRDPRLDGRESCAVCNRRYSWGCGHTPEMESAHLDHEQTTEHLLGDCECFVSRAGYAARFTREERRAQVARALGDACKVLAVLEASGWSARGCVADLRADLRLLGLRD